ncbi:unnamed protein product [Paramecium pentaurelia]|uniref:Uncharacterized protein n=1 Tax=Paramecium pentaurelia TaxID=43138 RepID=A0A8S1SBG1_9CILI|nr:unnamed protein product [Paramecium pentaurelia]
MFNYMAMNEQQVREGVQKYGPAVGARKIIDQEYQHALETLNTGIYITYYCAEQKSECSRIGSTSKCFCGHLFSQHKQQLGKKFNTGCEKCECKRFQFVPSRPEECGMYWLPRRKDFNILTWRPPCKCNHGCEDHLPNYPLRCRKCQCSDFDSYFACIACDRRWELHETLFEDESERKALGKKVGQDYLPLSTTPDIQQNVFQDQKYQQMPQKLQQGLVGNDKPFPKQQIQTNKQQQYTTAYTRPNQPQQKAIQQQQQQTNKIVQKKK